jgi:O-Antigen ligase
MEHIILKIFHMWRKNRGKKKRWSLLVNNYFRLNKENIFLYLFAGYLCTVQFSAAHWFVAITPIPLTALLVLFISILLFIKYVKDKKYKLKQNSEINRFIGIFILIALLSSLSSIYTMSVINSVEYMSYIKTSLPSRLVYYFTYVVFLFTGYYVFRDVESKQLKKVLKIYPFSLMLLVLIGIWQLAHFLFGIPFVNISTRSYIHSVSETVFFNFRLTSFLDEPSYLGPLLIDLMILGILIFKEKWKYVLYILIPSLIVLMFSFSVSAYINFAVMGSVAALLYIRKTKVPFSRVILGVGISFATLVLLLFVFNEAFVDFFSPILARGGSLFDVETSSRMYMYVMPFFWLFDHSFVSSLFGYGPGSFDFLAQTKILPSMGSVSTSSNNMFIDILFESGIVGLILIVTSVTIVGLNLFKHYRLNIFCFIAFVEFIHLILTSLYRADYATPRFWTLLLIIFLLNMIGRKALNHTTNDVRGGE